MISSKTTSHKVREQLGLSQSDFALLFGISVNTVRNWDSKCCMPFYMNRIMSMIIRYVPKEYLDYMLKCEKEFNNKADID